MGPRATPKPEETLKITVELVKLLRAGERLKELLGTAVPAVANNEARPPAQANTRTNNVHRKLPERTQQLAITDAVIPDAAPTVAHTIGKCQGICAYVWTLAS